MPVCPVTQKPCPAHAVLETRLSAVEEAEEEREALIRQTVFITLRDIGMVIDATSPAAIEDAREDFRTLRRLRQQIDAVSGWVAKGIVMALVSVVLGAVAIGARVMLR